MTESAFSAKYERFRQMLVEARKATGLTQIELAKRLGKPQSFVSKYESGERRLDVVEFLAIAKAIRTDPAEFLRKLAKE